MSTQIPETRCLKCQSLTNASSNVTGVDRPKPGDVNVCAYCAHVMAFADDMGFRELTEEERAEILSDPVLRDVVARVNDMIVAKTTKH